MKEDISRREVLGVTGALTTGFAAGFVGGYASGAENAEHEQHFSVTKIDDGYDVAVRGNSIRPSDWRLTGGVELHFCDELFVSDDSGQAPAKEAFGRVTPGGGKQFALAYAEALRDETPAPAEMWGLDVSQSLSRYEPQQFTGQDEWYRPPAFDQPVVAYPTGAYGGGFLVFEVPKTDDGVVTQHFGAEGEKYTTVYDDAIAFWEWTVEATGG